MPEEVDCVFCKIGRGQEEATILAEFPEAFVIAPINPVVDGHALVIPMTHVRDACHDSAVTAATFYVAAEYAAKFHSCNLITSVGELATQTVRHLHVHVIPRWANDGLKLPWS